MRLLKNTAPGCRLVFLCLWLLAGAASTTPLPAAEAPTHEYELKAADLYNFALFIEWPASALPTTNSPIIVGVLDSGEAMPVLWSVLAGKTANGRPVQLVPASTNRLGKNYHILFVTRAARQTPEALHAALDGTSTLLVGETDQFAERGGGVGFVREGDRIRFTLNLENTTQAGLKVSSHLATVARLVKRRREP